VSFIAKQATQGLWFDTSTKLTAVTARLMRAKGYVGAFRYLPLPSNSPAGDIDLAEASLITAASLELGLIQHVRFPGWDPTKQSGTVDAGIACFYAMGAGAKSGSHLFLDFEGARVGATVAQCKIYIEAWAASVIAHDYKAGLYVGYQIPLGPVDLYDLHGIDCYWSDFGHRQVATRGCAIVQQNPDIVVAGLKIDEDKIQPDLLGDLPWVTAAGPTSAAPPNV
jgi:hypothetical protein